MEKQYEIRKPVSLQAIEEAGPKNCAEFQRGLERAAFLVMHKRGYCCYDAETPLDCVLEIASQIKGGIEFLCDNGFIREKRPDLKIDDPILCGQHKKKRHFAGWSEEGNLMAFCDGKTSWTNEDDLFSWTEWELPTEKD